MQKDTEKAAKAFEKGCELDSFECCVNLSLMYKRGDGVTKDSQLAAKFQEMAHDIQKQSAERRDRITFQEGTETAGSAPLKFWVCTYISTYLIENTFCSSKWLFLLLVQKISMTHHIVDKTN